MIVARKWTDAAAALSCGLGVVLIATGVKPTPSVVSYLGVAAYPWGILLMASCLGAAAGAALRTRDLTAERRLTWSLILERVFWPAIGICCVVFMIGVVNAFGVIDGALTIGWTGFVVCTCAGHWWAIRQAARGVAK